MGTEMFSKKLCNIQKSTMEGQGQITVKRWPDAWIVRPKQTCATILKVIRKRNLAVFRSGNTYVNWSTKQAFALLSSGMRPPMFMVILLIKLHHRWKKRSLTLPYTKRRGGAMIVRRFKVCDTYISELWNSKYTHASDTGYEFKIDKANHVLVTL